MSGLPKVKFYLVHMETGQRYPVTYEELVIGRTSGDLLFPDDPRLSNQHCRILLTEAGLALHDMNSANGTMVDGKPLMSEKVYAFKVGQLLEVGAQAFKLQEAGHARKVKKKKPKPIRADKPDWLSRLIILTLIGASFYFGYSYLWRKAKPVSQAAVSLASPAELVDKEARFAFDRYKQIGQDFSSGALSETLMAQQIRKELLPLLQSVQLKLSVVRGQTEYEKRKIENTRQIVVALIGQTSAMVEYSETKSAQAQQRIRAYGDQLDLLNAKAKAFTRSPAQN